MRHPRDYLRLQRRLARRLVFRVPVPLGYDPRETILIAGTPRSGTTWLGQLLATIPRTSVVFEPLRGEAAVAAGVGWHSVEGRSVDDPSAIEYIRRSLQGKVRNGWTMRENSIGSILATRTWIVKEVRVNRLLPWLVRRFDLKRSVLLIRDPYAVISSQLRFAPDRTIAAWLGQPRTRPPQSLIDVYPWLGEIELNEHDVVAQLALQWALDQLVPLADPNPDWDMLGYEALQRDPVGELAQVLETWGMDVPAALEARVNVASSVSRGAVPRAWTRSSAWSEEFGPGDRQRIEDVCRRAGLELSHGVDRSPGPRLRSDLVTATDADSQA